jgi:hypothetical protein
MKDDIKNTLRDMQEILEKTEEVLSEWTSDGNLQFPSLLASLGLKMSLTDHQLREADAVVRIYIRRHSEYHVTRGAKGGIMRVSDKQKKEEEKSVKEAAKKLFKEQLEAKLAKVAEAKLAAEKSLDTQAADTKAAE